jgi:UDP-3-O-[3-hydroxymyristoyl] glucosamine N-acyltransferase LpxD
MTIKITSLDCAVYLGLKHHGDPINITQPASLEHLSHESLKFVSIFKENLLVMINKDSNCFFVVHQDYAGRVKGPHVLSSNPRLDFCKLCAHFFPKIRQAAIEDSAVIAKSAELGHNVYVGHNVVIEDGVKIGDNAVILHNVVISAGTVIGRNCLIKSGTIIGQKGFGFERDKDSIPVEFIHYGTVKIGDYVEVGALCTVVAGALSDTIIEDHCKIDDHVHIAHNVLVGSGSCIAACAEISGSVRIGRSSWLGPNCSIIDKISLGENSLVGIAANVISNFPDGSVLVGNPAKMIRVVNHGQKKS